VTGRLDVLGRAGVVHGRR